MTQAPAFDPKNMPFRQLGSTGLRVPVFSLGGWLTLGDRVKGDPVREIMEAAYNNGCNMFDTAEGYAAGDSELEMGRVIREVGWQRSDLIISTKIYFGTERKEPNSTGLSRKHIIEGTKASLKRLGLDYVDVIFAHRPDATTPIEETVRAFNFVIDQGWAFYWATSEWSAREIEEAHHVASRLNLIGPVAEQCKHSMLDRERPEGEYAPLYRKYRMGTTVFSALAGGVLTGKYNEGKVPEGSRFAKHGDLPFYKVVVDSFGQEEGQKKLNMIKELGSFAEKELGCTITHLALAWIAANPNTSTVILGASKPEQVLDNLKAIEVIPKLTPSVLEKIEGILGNKPGAPAVPARQSLDPTGRAWY